MRSEIPMHPQLKDHTAYKALHTRLDHTVCEKENVLLEAQRTAEEAERHQGNANECDRRIAELVEGMKAMESLLPQAPPEQVHQAPAVGHPVGGCDTCAAEPSMPSPVKPFQKLGPIRRVAELHTADEANYYIGLGWVLMIVLATKDGTPEAKPTYVMGSDKDRD